MAPLPKKKHSRSRSNQRRNANSKVFMPNLIKCSSCHKLRLPHTACPHCGFYERSKTTK